MSQSRTSRFRAAAVAGIPLAAIVLATLAPSAQADVDSVSGSAFAASLESSLLGQLVPPTPLVSGSATEPTDSYGPFDESALPVNVIGLLSVGVLNAFTQGDDVALGEPAGHFGFAQSRASVADVVVGLNSITADAIESGCTSNGDGSTGFTELIGATLDGDPLITTPLANTELAIPGVLEVVLNEQIRSDAVGSTSIIVRGARVTLLPDLLSTTGVVEIILSESRCAAVGPDVNAPPTTTTTTTRPPTTAAPTTTTSTTAPPAATTTTTAAPGTTTTTAAPAPTTTAPPAATTTAPVVTTTTTTIPPVGTTAPVATTTTTRPPTITPPPLARTGSNLTPMVGMALMAIALGSLVRRSAEAFAPVTVMETAPPPPPEFKPASDRPSAIRRRSRRGPLDPASSDALSAFDEESGDDR